MDAGPYEPPPLPPGTDASPPPPPEFDDPEEVVRGTLKRFPLSDPSAVRQTLHANLRRRDDGRWTWRYDPVLQLPHGVHLTKPTMAVQWAALARIRCPTLLVLGAEASQVPPSVVARMRDDMPDCRVVEVPRSGHTVHWDNRADFIAAVRRFLLGVAG